MALAHSPRIVTDGLVLCLDAGNTKSFKGEPTTNEIVSVTWFGDGGNQTGLVKSSVTVNEDYLKYKGYETYLWTPGTSLNCYLNGSDLSTGRTSTVWTFSCYVKRADGAAITSLNVYMYYPNTDGNASGTIESVGDGWYRVSRTRTGTNNYIGLIGFTGFVSGKKYYLSGAQLEKKSYPTTPTSTNTTRGTTVATGGGWKDLIRSNNGELVNGVRESSDNLGSLNFDGTNDYVAVGNLGLSSNTLEGWINSHTNQGGESGATIVSALGYYSRVGTEKYTYIGFLGSNKLTFRIDDGSTSHQQVADVTYTTNQWYHVALSYNSSTGSTVAYVNGSSVGSMTAATGIIFNNTPNDIARAENGKYFDGFVSMAKIYNRALTASEIQQNFNVSRGRYGV